MPPRKSPRTFDPPAVWKSPPPRDTLDVREVLERQRRRIRFNAALVVVGFALAGLAYWTGRLGIAGAMAVISGFFGWLTVLAHRHISRRAALMDAGVLLHARVDQVLPVTKRRGAQIFHLEASYTAPSGEERAVKLWASTRDGSEPVAQGDLIPMLVHPTAPGVVAAHLGKTPIGVLR